MRLFPHVHLTVVSAVFLTGAVSIWWQGARPSRTSELEYVGPIPVDDKPQDETSGTPREPATIVVHVGGAVKSPGVYILKKGQRVYEAVALAEPEEHADLDRLNLAAVLKDSQRIVVPRKGEAPGQGSDAYSDCGEGYGAGSGSSRPATGMPLFPLNVNTASQKELEALPGIDPALARAIVDYTERVGPFEKLEDLLDVSGIGEKVLAKISAYVVVDEVPPLGYHVSSEIREVISP